MTPSAAPLRTLHLNTERTWRGGEMQLYYLVDGLRARGHGVTILAEPDAPLDVRARKDGFDARPFAVHGEADLRAAWRLARLYRDERFDVVHAHTSHSHMNAILAGLLAPRARTPRLIVSRRVDFSIYRRSFLRLNGFKYKAGDRIIAVSEKVRQVLGNDGVDTGRIDVVHDGIDIGRIERAPERTAEVRRQFGWKEGEALVVNVAALTGHKGQTHLLAAVPELRRRVPNARVLVVGDGELRDALHAQARALSLGDALVFAGFRPPDEVPSILKAADVFAFSSVEEGLGSSLLEAMAAGAPIAATDAGGIPEIVKDGVTGRVVPKADPAALAGAIADLLLDRAAARRLAEEAGRFVRAHGTKERMVDETIAVYRQVLAAGAA